MTDEQFETQLAARLRAHSESGVRPFDAMEIARVAMAGSSGQIVREVRSGMPAWFRSLVLAGLLVVLLVAAAFVGGFIRLPTAIVDATPTATAVAVTPTPFASLTVDPSGSIDPSLSPSASPSASPSVSASPSPTASPSASPTASPSPTPTPTPASGWRELPLPGTAGGTQVNDTAYGNGLYVAVGYEFSSAPAESVDGRAWYSTDGATWRRAADAPGQANVVVATDDAFYALDPSGPQVRTWRSTDGNSWTVVGSSSELAFVNDIAYGNGVMVAVGSNEDFDQPMIWTSADGAGWSAIGAPDATSELTRVAVRGDDIAVLGDDFTGYGRRIFVRLGQEGAWQEFDPFGEDVDGRLLDLATNGGRFVSVGYTDNPNRIGFAVSSVDGSNWARSFIDSDSNLIFDQVVALPDTRFLAVASVPRIVECPADGCVLHELGQAWLSDDGVSWQLGGQIYERNETGPSEVGDMIEHPRAVATGSGGVVVFDRWYSALHVFFAPLATFAE